MTIIVAETEFDEDTIKPISLQFDDFSSVAVVSVEIYKNGGGNDLASTHMPGGSHATSGNIVTSKAVRNLVGKSFYILKFVVTVNGTTQQEARGVRILCVDPKSLLMRKR